MMKKLYIFDLDGTLVNSLYDLADSMNFVLKKYGYPVHDAEKYKYFVGNGTMKLVERAIPEGVRTDEKIRILHSEFSEEYTRRSVEKTRPYEGIIQLLYKLKENGCLLAVASNKPDKFSKYIVDTLFGTEIFDIVSGKKEGVPAKPAPDIVFDILSKLDVSSENALMTGDSNVDVLTAHNAGLKCIGCTWGFRGRQELIDAGADVIADDPAEIWDLI